MKSSWDRVWSRWTTMREKLLGVDLFLPRPHCPSLSLWIRVEKAAMMGLSDRGLG